MSKKVLLINGSCRKKNTYNILIQIAEMLKNHNIGTEILNLFDYDIKHCIGDDDSCIKKGDCSQKNDDMQMIRQKILDSDGVVLSSPVYLSGVTSKFKAFADRTNGWFHKPAPVGMPVLFVVTTAVTGIKETVHFIDQLTTGWGARKGGVITRANKSFNVPVEEKELSRFITMLQEDKKYYRPEMNEIVIFEVQKVMAQKSDGDDRRFWEARKWLDKCYYYDCKMGIAKKLFSKMMFRILSRAIK